MEQKQRRPLVYSWQVGRGVKRYERGKKLEQLLSEGKSLENAMAQVGVKTVGTARELIRYYRNAVEHSVQADGAYALPECPVCRKFHEHNHGGLA